MLDYCIEVNLLKYNLLFGESSKKYKTTIDEPVFLKIRKIFENPKTRIFVNDNPVWKMMSYKNEDNLIILSFTLNEGIVLGNNITIVFNKDANNVEIKINI